MNVIRSALRSALLCAVITTAALAGSACAGKRKAPAAEVVLEIFNQRTTSITASLTKGSTTTTLGRVAARDTRRWALPAQGDRIIHVTAADSLGTKIMSADLEVGKGPVLRWEIR